MRNEKSEVPGPRFFRRTAKCGSYLFAFAVLAVFAAAGLLAIAFAAFEAAFATVLAAFAAVLAAV